MNKIGKCRLCLLEKPLIKKSHIIPDFFFKMAGLYNDKHQIHKINIKEYKASKKFTYILTGDYESGILCKNCDNVLLGQLENYGRKVLYRGLSEAEYINCKNFINISDGLEYSICENVNYTKFKLFLLSILWRASISNRDIFKQVDISDYDKENIRLMLINRGAGRVNQYPITIYSFLKDKKMPRDLILQPKKSINHDEILITFPISVFIFVFYINDNYKNIEEIKEKTLTEDNKLTILHLPLGGAWNFILKYANIK